MTAWTSPAGMSRDRPSRIGLSATETERLWMESMEDIQFLPPSPLWGGSTCEASGVGKCGLPWRFGSGADSPTPLGLAPESTLPMKGREEVGFRNSSRLPKGSNTKTRSCPGRSPSSMTAKSFERAALARARTSSTRNAMCAFFAGTKRLLDAEMHLHRPLEPAPAAPGELRRLRLFDQAEHSGIERPRGVLAARRHGELNVIDGLKRHGRACSLRRSSSRREDAPSRRIGASESWR